MGTYNGDTYMKGMADIVGLVAFVLLIWLPIIAPAAERYLRHKRQRRLFARHNRG